MAQTSADTAIDDLKVKLDGPAAVEAKSTLGKTSAGLSTASGFAHMLKTKTAAAQTHQAGVSWGKKFKAIFTSNKHTATAADQGATITEAVSQSATTETAALAGTTRALGGVSKVAGKLAAPLAIAAGGVETYMAIKDKDGHRAAQVAGGTAGTLSGGWAGLAAGGVVTGVVEGLAVGGIFGSVFPVVGTIVFGIAGAVIGGWLAGKATDKVAGNWLHEKLNKQAPVVAGSPALQPEVAASVAPENSPASDKFQAQILKERKIKAAQEHGHA